MARTKRKLTVTSLSDVGPTRKECEACGRYTAKPSCLYPRVPVGWTGEYALVIPYATETATLASGKRVPVWTPAWREVLRYAELSEKHVALIPALRCGTGDVGAKQGRACRPYLIKALETLRPKYVMLAGLQSIKVAIDRWTDVSFIDSLGRDLTHKIPELTWPTTVYSCADVETSPASTASCVREFQRFTEPVLTLPDATSEPLRAECVAVDTEFEGGEWLTIAVSDGNIVNVTDRTAPNPAVFDVIRSAVSIMGHYVWVDLDILVKEGLAKEDWVRGVHVVDTFLLARMGDENLGQGAYGLDALMRRWHNVPAWKDETDAIDEARPSLWPAPLRIKRCGVDAWASWKLAIPLAGYARGPVVMTHRLSAVLHRVQLAGVAIDRVALDQLVERLTPIRETARERVTRLASICGVEDFSPTNDQHVRKVVYGALGLTPIATTPSGELSVAKDALLPYRHYPFVEQLMAFNEADRTLKVITGEKGIYANLTTYRDGVDLLPVNIRALQAKTARRSSTNPNMQNWTLDMRKLVRSRWENGLILDVDYKSLEPRVLGSIAPDYRYLEYFVDGLGYVGIAKDVLHKHVDKGTPEYRTVKEVVLGTNYGAGPQTIGRTLWNKLDIKLARTYEQHEKEVRKIQDRYLTTFSGIQAYMARQERALLRDGYVRTATGRVRHLPCPEGRKTTGFGHLLNQAYNFPIQSLASDITGSALIDTEDAICTQAGISRLDFHYALMVKRFPEVPLLVNEIHDEIVFDVPPTGALSPDDWTALIVNVMRSVPTFRSICQVEIPLDVECVIGPTWGLKS